MKTLYLLFSFILTISIQAQQISQKNDIIVLSNGKLIQAQVTRVSDDIISFQYPGESLQNEIKIDQLEKIVFSSGRTQNFSTISSDVGESSKLLDNNPQSTSQPQIQNSQIETQIDEAIGEYNSNEIYLLPDYSENSLAVIPFNFVDNGTYSSDFAAESTNYATNYLIQQSENYNLNVQEINTTVKQLIDAQIGLEALGKVSDQKLLQTANTEYIVRVNIDQKSNKAPKLEERSSLKSYFGKRPAQKQDPAAKPSGDRVDISLDIYSAQDAKLIYSVSLSETRKPLSIKGLSSVMPLWKSSLTHMLNGFLSTRK